MKKLIAACLLMAASNGGAATAPAIDTAGYALQRGWTPYHTRDMATSPVSDVAPVMFYNQGNSVPSCGVLTVAAPGEPPNFIELVGSDPGVGFPQCLAIVSLTLFRLQSRDYIGITYLSRDTREDAERGFHYLVHDPARGWDTDTLLTSTVAAQSVGAAQPQNIPSLASADVLRRARLATLRSSAASWQLVERDVISDKSSSFAIEYDQKDRQCRFSVEAGASAVVVAHTSFAHSATCDEVLASSRYQNAEKTYYLAMFAIQGKLQRIGVMSVAADGRIDIETALSDSINRSGATADMKTAKAALARLVR